MVLVTKPRLIMSKAGVVVVVKKWWPDMAWVIVGCENEGWVRAAAGAAAKAVLMAGLGEMAAHVLSERVARAPTAAGIEADVES